MKTLLIASAVIAIAALLVLFSGVAAPSADLSCTGPMCRENDYSYLVLSVLGTFGVIAAIVGLLYLRKR